MWIDRLGNLRNTIRQEVIRRQLAEHARAGMTVLDVGCGQGTQAIHLARAGCTVTGVEPSGDLRELCAASAEAAGASIELLAGSLEELPTLVGDRRYDLVCAHGVLMYLPDRRGAIRLLPRRCGPVDCSRSPCAMATHWRCAPRSAASGRRRGPPWRRDVPQRARRHRARRPPRRRRRRSRRRRHRAREWHGVRVFNDHVDAAIVPSAGRTSTSCSPPELEAGPPRPLSLDGVPAARHRPVDGSASRAPPSGSAREQRGFGRAPTGGHCRVGGLSEGAGGVRALLGRRGPRGGPRLCGWRADELAGGFRQHAPGDVGRSAGLGIEHEAGAGAPLAGLVAGVDDVARPAATGSRTRCSASSRSRRRSSIAICSSSRGRHERRQPVPVLLGGGAALGERCERVADLVEA